MQSLPNSNQGDNQQIYWKSTLGSSLREAISFVFFPPTDQVDGGDDLGGGGMGHPSMQQEITPEYHELEKKIMHEFNLVVQKKF